MVRSVMSLFLILILAFFAIWGCQSENQLMTDTQKSEVTETIDDLMSDFIAANSKVDTTFFLSYYHEVDDAIFGIDNTITYDYEQVIASLPEFAKAIDHQEVTSINSKILVLSPTSAVVSSYGQAEVYLKNGEKSSEDFGWTIVWKNINGDWKIVHIHQSLKTKDDSAE